MRTVAWPASHNPSKVYCPHASLASRQRGTRAARSTRVARPPSATARADTVPVWETLVLVNAAPDAAQSSEDQQELLDTLWSLQYRTPGACCASAGPVVQSASRDGASAARAAVYYRFSAQAQAERFVAGPAFADAKARLLGSGSVALSLWKVLVPNDMEALFKRGPAFDSGVDLVLVLQPAATPAAGAGPGAPVAADAVVEVAGRLQRAALAAGSAQVSCGVDVMSLGPQYVWMARFPQEDSAQRFLRSPVVAELSAGMGAAAPAGGSQQQQPPVGSLVLTSWALVEVGSVQQSKQRL